MNRFCESIIMWYSPRNNLRHQQYLLLLLSVILSCNVIGQNVVTSLEINMDIATYPREKKDIELLEFNTLFSRMRISFF